MYMLLVKIRIWLAVHTTLHVSYNGPARSEPYCSVSKQSAYFACSAISQSTFRRQRFITAAHVNRNRSAAGRDNATVNQTVQIPRNVGIN